MHVLAEQLYDFSLGCSVVEELLVDFLDLQLREYVIPEAEIGGDAVEAWLSCRHFVLTAKLEISEVGLAFYQLLVSHQFVCLRPLTVHQIFNEGKSWLIEAALKASQ